MSPALHSNNPAYTEKGGVSLKRKVLVAAGPSGGHIFPALSFIESLREKSPQAEILLILPKDNILKDKNLSLCPVKYISVPVFKPGFKLGNLKRLLKLFNAGLESLFLSLKFKPDIVVGFGSLICIPVILSAWLFRVETIIHEQNVIPGRANKFLANFCDKIAISFQETANYFRQRKKIVYSGNPIRKTMIKIDRKKALGFFGLQDDKFTILVLGGSQGSQRINEVFLQFILGLMPKDALQVIHLSGANDYDEAQKDYAASGIKVKLFSFLDSMEYAYSAADLVLSRAGAGTVTEIISFKIPAVIIPYPHAHQHQLANAKVLEKYGCAVVIEDKDLSADLLKKVLTPLINNRDRLNCMLAGYGNFREPSLAARDLAGIVLASE